jgi:hypothetical protein
MSIPVANSGPVDDGLRSRTKSPSKPGQEYETIDGKADGGNAEYVDEESQLNGFDQHQYLSQQQQPYASSSSSSVYTPQPQLQRRPQAGQQKQKQKQTKKKSLWRRVLVNLFYVLLLYLLLKVYVLGEKKRAEMRAKWERERVVHANR